MSERMSNADVGFLYRETRTAPQHVGGIIVLDTPAGGLDYDRLVRLLEERISLAPRYRQRVRTIPGHLANPLWIDDPRFDITYHARRSALPRPGTDRQLLDFAARILSRRLDRSRPLWEMYLVEGLDRGRTAIITKTHPAMVGEADGIDLAQVILDAAPAPRRTVEALWMPEAEPGSVALVRDAVLGVLRRPRRLTETVRSAVHDAHQVSSRALSLAGGVAAASHSGARRPPASLLAAELGEQRRIAIARTRLADYRRVRDAFGGTVNDVALAAIAGALRGWLLARSAPLRSASTVRALVPVSVAGEADRPPAAPGDGTAPGGDAGPSEDSEARDVYPEGRENRAGSGHPAWHADLSGSGHRARSGDPRPDPTTRRRDFPLTASAVRPLLVDLPVGEPDPTLRLAQVRFAMATHAASGRAVDAHTLTELAGFAPPTLHALGARAASELTRRMFSLVVTNVPGPQQPLYAAGATMREMFPISPLSAGQAISIALASYDGGVYFGVNGDWDAASDVASLAEMIEDSLAELVAATDTGAVTAARPLRVATRRRGEPADGRER